MTRSGSVLRFAPFALCLAISLHAQTPKMVADINSTVNPRNAGSDPFHGRPGSLRSEQQAFVKVGPIAYFRARTQAQGLELWQSIGNTATTQLVKDIFPGPGNSDPRELTVVGANLFFAADDGTNGRELWVLDASGAHMVKDINPGPVSSDPNSLAEFGGKLLFAASDPKNGTELWISDGTAAGTMLVRDIQTGSGDSLPRNMTPNQAGTLAVFSAAGTGRDTELWVTDGTTAGTKLVKDIRPGTNGSNPLYFQQLGSRLVFQASDGSTGNELWITDGTAAGTTMVKDVRPGTSSGTNLYYSVVVGNKVFFGGNDGSTGTEVWMSDGTASGTRRLADIYPGSTSGNFLWPAVNGGKVYFATRPSTSGYAIWETDGSTTKAVTNAIGTSSPSYLRWAGGKLFFAARGTTGGYELWVSDGTIAGTKLLKDINTTTSTASSSPRYLTETIPGRVVFGADDGKSGVELWASDGTNAGTTIIDINKPATPITDSSSPWNVTNLFGKLLFTAYDGSSGTELWISDGTSAGTKLLKDIRPGTSSGSPYYFARLGNRVFFRANDGSSGYELWVTDGTPAGTQLFLDIRPGSSSSSPAGLARIGDKIYFYANDGSTGGELWVTDGTTAGTKLVKDIRSGTSSSSPRNFTPLGTSGQFLFTASDSSTGYELYISDGTAAGTKLVKDINPGTSSSSPIYLTPLAGKVYFAASDATNGRELWVSDGTAAGTTMVKDVYPGQTNGNPNSSGPAYLAVLGNKIFFGANDGKVGNELWETDGTAAGTKLFLDINPGFGGGGGSNTIDKESSIGPSYLTRVGSRHIWFAAARYPNGVELWMTDGTVAGTKQVADVAPGNNSFYPQMQTDSSHPFYAVMNGKVYFRGNDGTHGNELWVVDNGATATEIGRACGSSTLSATDPVLGQVGSVSGSTQVKSPINVLLLGLPQATPTLLPWGCYSYLDLSNITVLGANALASWTLPMPIPNVAALDGATITLQAWTLPPSFPAGIELSNGVNLTLGH